MRVYAFSKKRLNENWLRSGIRFRGIDPPPLQRLFLHSHRSQNRGIFYFIGCVAMLPCTQERQWSTDDMPITCCWLQCYSQLAFSCAYSVAAVVASISLFIDIHKCICSFKSVLCCIFFLHNYIFFKHTIPHDKSETHMLLSAYHGLGWVPTANNTQLFQGTIPKQKWNTQTNFSASLYFPCCSSSCPCPTYKTAISSGFMHFTASCSQTVQQTNATSAIKQINSHHLLTSKWRK